MSNASNLIGQKFNKMAVLSRADNNKHGKTMWLCRCECGTEKIVLGATLVSGETRSCGCLIQEVMKTLHKTHGKSNTRVYRIWRAMINRCENSTQRYFKKYNALGICDRWKLSFEDFYADMGEPPTSKHSIDRKDNSKGYEPENCRWATPKEQADNSRIPKLITFNGKTQNVTEWARELKMNGPSMIERLRKWPLEKALTKPKAKRFR